MSEEKLKELLHLREVQDQVIALRTEAPPIYGKYLKEEASLLLKSLVNSDVSVDACSIEKPKHFNIDIEDYRTEPDDSLQVLNKCADDLAKCLKYYKK